MHYCSSSRLLLRNVFDHPGFQRPSATAEVEAKCSRRDAHASCRLFGTEAGPVVKVDGPPLLRRQRFQCPVEITDEMMLGVVSMPHGWGHHREDMRLSVASAHPGVSINDITDEKHIDPLTGNAGFSDVPVTVTALKASDSP